MSSINSIYNFKNTSTNSLEVEAIKYKNYMQIYQTTLTNHFNSNCMSKPNNIYLQPQLTKFFNNLNSNKMFKYIFFLLLAIPFLTSCGGNDTKQREVAKPKTTVVLLYDISTSNDEFAL